MEPITASPTDFSWASFHLSPSASMVVLPSTIVPSTAITQDGPESSRNLDIFCRPRHSLSTGEAGRFPYPNQQLSASEALLHPFLKRFALRGIRRWPAASKYTGWPVLKIHHVPGFKSTKVSILEWCCKWWTLDRNGTPATSIIGVVAIRSPGD